jgi:hypothetical protein
LTITPAGPGAYTGIYVDSGDDEVSEDGERAGNTMSGPTTVMGGNARRSACTSRTVPLLRVLRARPVPARYDWVRPEAAIATRSSVWSKLTQHGHSRLVGANLKHY